VSPRHLTHHGPRHQRLFNDPRLLVLAPTPSALDPENLPIHLCMTLRLAQRSYPSRRTPSQQGGRRRADTLWRLFPVRWTAAAIEKGYRTKMTDAVAIEDAGERGIIESIAGGKPKAVGFIINCPVFYRVN
jgi:hypothetical protein